jgi:glycosyltransferase involved in cell wall biosynthesis
MSTETILAKSGDEPLPWVTIVTPTYNQSAYLAETIDSVLAQDYPRLEYIVLDDGSTDDTPAVLARYDGKIQHQRHDNIGQSSTLNRGWAMARGSLIGYLSSDDLLEPGAISHLVTALQTHPDAVVAYGDFKLIDAKGRHFRDVKAEDFDVNRLCVDLVCQPGPGALMRRQLFDETGGWATHLRQVPDFDFWLRAVQFGPFIRVAEALSRYRIHEESASFSAITPSRSIEIVSVVSNHWQKSHSRNYKRAMANAHLLAAKNHAQANRFGQIFLHWLAAIKFSPRIIIASRAWKMLLSGMFRRLAYTLFGRAR